MQPKVPNAGADQGPVIYPWPEGVAQVTGLSAPTLQRMRARGDAPRLYAVSERNLVTTSADLLQWVTAKAVPTSYKCRQAVPRRAKEVA